MSEPVSTTETTAAAPESTVATAADAAQQSTTAEAGTTHEAVKSEPQQEQEKVALAKFRNEDGTFDTDRLAKSYENLEKKLRSKPNLSAASVDEYEWAAPENAIDIEPEGLAAFKKEALAQGFSNKQYQFLMSRYNDILVGVRDAGPTAEKTKQALQDEWGNEYKQQLTHARNGFDEFAPSTANPNDPVWNHPEVMKLLARIGSEVQEDSINPRSTAGAAESVQAQIDALRSSPDYWKPENQAKVLALYEKLG